METHPDDPPPPPPPPSQAQSSSTSKSTKSSQWLTLAIGSGAFAALNGVFAKLTTTAQTHDIAASISRTFGFDADNTLIEFLIRAMFFGFNLLSNAVMWILFTRALTAATSTTRVSILNVSANFVVTAVLGMLVFAEGLPFTWWLGASLLVAGSVVIGRREGAEQGAKGTAAGGEGESVPLDDTGGRGASGTERYTDEEGDSDGSLDADTVVKSMGAGGVEQDIMAQGRFTDDSDAEESGSEDDNKHNTKFTHR